MSKDGRDALAVQIRKPYVNLRLNTEVAEFDQQISAAGYAISLRGFGRALHVLVRKMEVAPQAQLRSVADTLLQVLQQAGQIFAVVEVPVVGVRRSDYV